MKRIIKASSNNERLTDDQLWDVLSDVTWGTGITLSHMSGHGNNSWTFQDKAGEVYVKLSDADVRNIVSYEQSVAKGDKKKLKQAILEEILRYNTKGAITSSSSIMKRIIKASSDNSMYYYLISVGSGLAWPYLYVIETEDATTDYGYLVDELIDYLDTNSPERLIDPSSFDAEYTWGEDEDGNECLVEINNPYEVAFYEDSYTVGGNYGKILLHYGQFDIREIDEATAKKYVKENNATLIEV